MEEAAEIAEMIKCRAKVGDVRGVAGEVELGGVHGVRGVRGVHGERGVHAEPDAAALNVTGIKKNNIYT